MKKYNLSNIMKEAWRLYRDFQQCVAEYKLSFSECLKRAWAKAKKAVATSEKIASSYFYGEIAGCSVHFNLGDGIVSGNTFRCKEILRRYGLHFNFSEKYWEGSRDSIRKLALDYV
ncbi:hypothetical protein V3C10_04410 [[Clostridium] symbiosum]|uniref:hypothetical protein n=1 Tax=Clostridium symbiosum TaxID=1512 RepID=UPI001D060F29|nr:hypothetical protein [[Clostridium] symbiosum]MCB6610173.1 hypothetical protein [[Clostridium] symbiosum]MCB6933509.1 hypothetical protein [[Clostridium] symbiosum]